MSLPPMECIYVTAEFVRECKNGNPTFRLPSPVPMLRFLCELCSSMVLSLNHFFVLHFPFYFCVNMFICADLFGLKCGVEFFECVFCLQVRGELPFQKCKAALELVEFSDKSSEEELVSCFADIVTQMAQDVRYLFPLLNCFYSIVSVFMIMLLGVWQNESDKESNL